MKNKRRFVFCQQNKPFFIFSVCIGLHKRDLYAKIYADGEKGMQRTNILNLDIKQSKLYGFFKNAVLLLLFLFFSIFGKSFVQFGSLFKEVFARMAAEEMMCVLQFALNELGRFYFAVKAAVAALALCTGIFNACRAIFASVRKGRGLGVRFVARRAVASVDGAAVFAHPFIRSVSDIKNSFSPRFRRGKFQSDFFLPLLSARRAILFARVSAVGFAGKVGFFRALV